MLRSSQIVVQFHENSAVGEGGGGPANFEAVILRNVAMNGTNLTVELPMEILITRTANRLNVWPNFSQFMVTLINFSRRD